MKRIVVVGLLLALGLLLGAGGTWVVFTHPEWVPGDFISSQEPESKPDKSVKYVGPMHPQIVQDEPGTCPICGMDLVPKEVGQDTSQAKSEAQPAEDSEKEVLYWVAPMDPSYKRDKPGKSPMGMDLVPVYAEDVADKPGTVRIDPAVVNNLGVRTTEVKRRDLSRTFRTVGEVTYNQREVSHIHTRVKGWVERLYLEAPGDRVDRGQAILEIYSPELVTAQEEYLLALRRQKRFQGSRGSTVRDLEDMVRQARERLMFFGVSKQEIEQIARTGEFQPTIVLRAPHSGVVTELGVREGMRVTPEKMLYTVADLSTVWVMAHVYASQAEWVSQDDRVSLRLPFYPGQSWSGRVEYVHPYLEPQTRTVKTRLVFANQDGTLKPNMFATAVIHADPLQDVLAVPQQAVIRTGKRAVVVTALGQGRFRPVEVVPGIESGQWVQIKTGLAQGQSVVTSGQFLLDAESNLQAGLQRLTSQKETKDAESTKHKAMDMPMDNASSHPDHTDMKEDMNGSHQEHQGHSGNATPTEHEMHQTDMNGAHQEHEEHSDNAAPAEHEMHHEHNGGGS